MPPFNTIRTGEIDFLKEAAGPVGAIALTSAVHFFGPLEPGEAGHLIEKYHQGLCLDSDFKIAKRHSVYATLITFEAVLSVKPFATVKFDRRLWVMLADGRKS
jgi:hypothetical protein